MLRGIQKRHLAGIAGVFAVIVAIACGSETTQTNSPGTVQAAATATSTATASSSSTASPPRSSDGPNGELVVATPGFGPVDGLLFNGRDGNHQYFHSFNQENLFWGGFEGDPMTPMLATGWSLDSSLQSINIQLREGVTWNAPKAYSHIDFGFFTADDYALWLNLSNPRVNENSAHLIGGGLSVQYGEAKKINDLEVEIELTGVSVFAHPFLTAYRWIFAGPDFVRGIEMMGEEWTEKNPVGTGPFVFGECAVNDRCSSHAVNNHWRKTPEFETLTFVAAGDSDAVLAMLENGIADVEFSGVRGLLGSNDIPDGMHLLSFGGFQGQSIAWSGNLWEETHPLNGKSLEPWDSQPYDTDLPWIGDPWQELQPDKVRYVDNDNPAGMTDMEQARLVRLALSIAVDRQAVIDEILPGRGIPLYSEYMGPEYPGWDPDRSTTNWTFDGNEIEPIASQQPVPWELDDGNMAEADRLLALAGYPLVDGVRRGFDELMYLYAGGGGEVGRRVNFVATLRIMETWAKLGIPIADLGFDPNTIVDEYRGVISTKMRTRDQFFPVFKNGDIFTNNVPLEWPFPAFDTSLSRGGGIGFESPFLTEQLLTVGGIEEKSLREMEHLRTVDYMLFWQLYSGVFQSSRGVIATDRIKEWNAPVFTSEGVSWAGWAEYIVLND